MARFKISKAITAGVRRTLRQAEQRQGTPPRPTTPSRTPTPRATPPRPTPSPRATPPRPSTTPTLGQLTTAFAPKFVLPQDLRQKQIARGIKATARAVRRVSRQRGISSREAGEVLIRTRKQIERRNVALRRGRLRGVKPSRTLAALGLAGGIDKKLLKVRRSSFVTPEGAFEIASVPGLVLGRRRLRPSPRPRPRPTPVATPRR